MASLSHGSAGPTGATLSPPTSRRAVRGGPIAGLAGLIVLAALATWFSTRSGQPPTPTHGSAADPAQLWAWNGSTFSPTPGGDQGPNSTDADMAFDRGRHVMVLWDHGCSRLVFGFTGGCQQRVNSTWTWTAGAWIRQAPRSTPAEVRQGVMVYDSRLGAVLYVNGDGQAWAWTGSDWTPTARPGLPRVIPPSQPSRLVASAFAAGFDEDRGLLVLMQSDRTWSWDGARWTQTPGGIELSEARPDPHLLYDNAGHALVYVGSHSTWSWDGVAWSAAPQPQLGPGTAAYDRGRRALVYVETTIDCDRSNCATVTWLRDPGGWSALRDLPGPRLSLARSGYFLPPMAYDEGAGMTMLFASGR